LRITRHVRHHEPWVLALRRVLGLDDHTPRPVPARSRVAKRAENTLRLGRLLKLSVSPLDLVSCRALQDRVLGQPQDVANAVRIAPAHQPPPAKSAVGTQS